MVIWAAWYLAESKEERIQFNEKRFGLADQAVRVSIRTGIVMEQRVT